MTGPECHPLYQELITEKPDAKVRGPDVFRQKLIGFGTIPNPAPGILWNFEKFIVDRNGTVVDRFSPEIAPDDPIVLASKESALKS